MQASKRKRGLLAALAGAALTAAGAEPPGTNTDESKVKAYVLPEPLVCFDGRPVKDEAAWRQARRPEILAAFETNVYGRVPSGLAARVRSAVQESDGRALGGLATRRQVELRLFGEEDAPRIGLLLYIPNGAPKPVPAFLGLSYGNQGVSADPAVIASRDTVSTNAQHAQRWPLEMILKRGYAVATFAGADVEIDRHGSGTDPKKRADGWRLGVRGYAARKAGRDAPADDEWGTLAAWAWGLSHALDYLETDRDIDARKVAVFGHSRTGKAALWAAAQDERFALAVSNNSGEGGAALARRWFGETVKHLPEVWFAKNYRRFADNVEALPVDQHLLLALLAPRPVYVASATEDTWADPRGEFLSGVAAGEVFALFGLVGLGTKTWPEANRAIGATIGYHLRPGKHDLTAYDWERYLDFADQQLRPGN